MECRFEIEITGTEGHTWRGLLHTQEGTVPFRSELELLWELECRLGRTPDEAHWSAVGAVGHRS